MSESRLQHTKILRALSLRFDPVVVCEDCTVRRYKYSSKLLYEITVFMVRVKVRKTKSLKLSSAAARP